MGAMNNELEKEIRKNLSLVSANFERLLDDCDAVVPWFSKVKKIIQVALLFED